MNKHTVPSKILETRINITRSTHVLVSKMFIIITFLDERKREARKDQK
jgi:hypothetical protein